MDIKSLHLRHLSEHNKQNPLDDSEYIPLMKRIIEAIDKYVGSFGNAKSDKLWNQKLHNGHPERVF